MEKNRKVVLVGGCFDILHYGHLTFLKNAKKKGDYLVIALECDDFIFKNKKKKPIHNQSERAEILESLKFVDKVIKLPLMKTDDDYFEMVKKVGPHVIAVTKGDPQMDNKKRQAKLVGAVVKEVVPLISEFSSSKVQKNASFSGS